MRLMRDWEKFEFSRPSAINNRQAEEEDGKAQLQRVLMIFI
jgi:hypothetical protein